MSKGKVGAEDYYLVEWEGCPKPTEFDWISEKHVWLENDDYDRQKLKDFEKRHKAILKLTSAMNQHDLKELVRDYGKKMAWLQS